MCYIINSLSHGQEGNIKYIFLVFSSFCAYWPRATRAVNKNKNLKKLGKYISYCPLAHAIITTYHILSIYSFVRRVKYISYFTPVKYEIFVLCKQTNKRLNKCLKCDKLVITWLLEQYGIYFSRFLLLHSRYALVQ